MGSVASVFAKKTANRYHDNVNDLFDYEEMSSLIAKNPVLRAYFVKYIKLGAWMEKFPSTSPESEIIRELYLECGTVVPFDIRSSVQMNKGKTQRSLSRWNASSSSIDYTLPVFEYTNSRSSISLKSVSPGIQKRDSFARKGCGGLQSIESFCFTDFGGVDSSFSLDEMAAIFFVTIFSYFRESAMFTTFQKRLFMQCESTKSLDSVEFISQDEEGHQQHQHARGGNHAQKLVYNAAALFDEEQLFSMLSNTDWYDNHIPSIIDNMAMSVSIANCCTGHSEEGVEQRYPLIYVNKAYETLTGFSKQEVLHKSDRILEGPSPDMEAVERLREAVKHRNAVREVMIQHKKNGKEFRSLLILSPVFDRVGECTHILTVQLDVTVYPASPQDVKLMEDLLALLPGMISTKLDIKIYQLL